MPKKNLVNLCMLQTIGKADIHYPYSITKLDLPLTRSFMCKISVE